MGGREEEEEEEEGVAVYPVADRRGKGKRERNAAREAQSDPRRIDDGGKEEMLQDKYSFVKSPT